MENNSKVQIYKGMIQYLLESTSYTLQNIADLSETTVENIKLIHDDGILPLNFSFESQLVKLYHIALSLHSNYKKTYKYTVEIKQFIS